MDDLREFSGSCLARRSFGVLLALAAGVAATRCFAQLPHAMTEKDVDRLVIELSNWGRWGKDDQCGTLNLLTPETRIAAARLVTLGQSVSLSRDLDETAAADNPAPFEQKMLSVGRDASGQFALDNYSISYHGSAHTHMDALCHLFYRDRMYNGFSRNEVATDGAHKLSIATAKEGIVARGLLVDVPRLRGVRFLEPGAAVYSEDFDEWEEQTGLAIRSDVVVRTGRWARRDLVGPWNAEQQGMAGMHASCAAWLKARDVAIVGSDSSGDVIPTQIENVTFPMHILLLHAMGTPMLDNCGLEALATKAAELNRWEFLLTASPLAAKQGTGSPLNPIATF